MTDPRLKELWARSWGMLKGKPYIYNIRDMYPDMAVGGAMSSLGIGADLGKMHRWALRRAACVIVLGEDMKKPHQGERNNAAKIEIVREGRKLPRTVRMRPFWIGK